MKIGGLKNKNSGEYSKDSVVAERSEANFFLISIIYINK